ncbi:hypothetical protein LK09_15280 [Microbacterium mangrovi]|uniref:Uncharacterized protein n=1 Tax=Microbacterium mangrovi TaxID=1348253 RepID=A0A0B2A038_9MICO|nr:hypothetical protein [Microbacterium mangrovi]KHK96351.1 hypothetical protein LK09_15280 [Microbacterium mangrovi]
MTLEPAYWTVDTPWADVGVRRFQTFDRQSSGEIIVIAPGGIVAYSETVPGTILRVVGGRVTLFARDHFTALFCPEGSRVPVPNGYWCRNDSRTRTSLEITHPSGSGTERTRA